MIGRNRSETHRPKTKRKRSGSELRINKSAPVIIRKQPTGIKLIVIPFHHDLADAEPIEFTLIDPASGRAWVKDGSNVSADEGTILGSEQHVGELRRLCFLDYEVNGKRFRPCNTIKEITIVLPSGETFRL